jgi:hypothetical protein
MNKKALTLIIAILSCLGFSIASFFIGINIARNDNDSNNDSSNAAATSSDSKYEGIYLSTTYNNGNQVTSELYLNANHDCTNPHYKKEKYTSCTWAVDGNKIVVTTIGGGALGKTIDQCKQIQQEQYTGKESKIITFDKDDEDAHDGYSCMVQSPSSKEYDILNDGSLYDGSYRGETYYKRG